MSDDDTGPPNLTPHGVPIQRPRNIPGPTAPIPRVRERDQDCEPEPPRMPVGEHITATQRAIHRYRFFPADHPAIESTRQWIDEYRIRCFRAEARYGADGSEEALFTWRCDYDTFRTLANQLKRMTGQIVGFPGRPPSQAEQAQENRERTT